MVAGESHMDTHHDAVSSKHLALRAAAFIEGMDVVFLLGHDVNCPVSRQRRLNIESASQSAASPIAQWNGPNRWLH